MTTETSTLMFSSKSDEWYTPNAFFKDLDKTHNFTLDPCATAENRKCDKFYSIEQDGLQQSWLGETVFVNPPYSKIADWVKKCHDEFISGGVLQLFVYSSPPEQIPGISMTTSIKRITWR